MKHGMKHLLKVILVLLVLPGTGQALAAVPLYGVFETSVTNTTPYANKFRDVDLNVTYTSPTGKEIPFFGFFDGDGTGGPDHLDVWNFPQDNAGELTGTVWKLRFLADEVGTWTYEWRFSDNSASGTGSFTCVPDSTRRGVLTVHQTNKRWLVDARGEPYFPKALIDPNRQLPYSADAYGPVGYDTLIDHGYDMIAIMGLPVWNWPTLQHINPLNGTADKGFYLWYQSRSWNGPDSYQEPNPDPGAYDTERMNLFAWHRIEEHVKYLADRGVYTWGFQGFHIKRTEPIRPQEFAPEKHRWYIRYCMARLAPYYNIVWHNTWESSGGAADFKKYTEDDGYDPWGRAFFQVGGDNPDLYDINAVDRINTIPSGWDRPVWSTESNNMWGKDEDMTVNQAWWFATQGITGFMIADLFKETVWASQFEKHENKYRRVADCFKFFADETNFGEFTLHNDLVDNGAVCSGKIGSEYVVYKSGGGSFNLELAAGTYNGQWLNHKTNDRLAVTGIEGGQTVAFTAAGDYWTLHLKKHEASDTTPPSHVMNLSATAIHESRVALSWDSATDPESGIANYTVYRDGAPVGTPANTAFTDTTTEADTTYSYSVAAVNGSGLEGDPSDPAQVTTPSFDNPPTVSMVTPADESKHGTGTAMTLSAEASDPEGDVVSVEFVVITQSGGNDEVLRATDTDGGNGWSVVWDDPAADNYDISATATDSVGKSTESSSIVVHVLAPGDIDGNGTVDPGDGIRALQISAGQQPARTGHIEADVDGNGKLDLADAIYVLQAEAGAP